MVRFYFYRKREHDKTLGIRPHCSNCNFTTLFCKSILLGRCNNSHYISKNRDFPSVRFRDWNFGNIVLYNIKRSCFTIYKQLPIRNIWYSKRYPFRQGDRHYLPIGECKIHEIIVITDIVEERTTVNPIFSVCSILSDCFYIFSICIFQSLNTIPHVDCPISFGIDTQNRSDAIFAVFSVRTVLTIGSIQGFQPFFDGSGISFLYCQFVCRFAIRSFQWFQPLVQCPLISFFNSKFICRFAVRPIGSIQGQQPFFQCSCISFLYCKFICRFPLGTILTIWTFQWFQPLLQCPLITFFNCKIICSFAIYSGNFQFISIVIQQPSLVSIGCDCPIIDTFVDVNTDNRGIFAIDSILAMFNGNGIPFCKSDCISTLVCKFFYFDNVIPCIDCIDDTLNRTDVRVHGLYRFLQGCNPIFQIIDILPQFTVVILVTATYKQQCSNTQHR